MFPSSSATCETNGARTIEGMIAVKLGSKKLGKTRVGGPKMPDGIVLPAHRVDLVLNFEGRDSEGVQRLIQGGSQALRHLR